MRYICILLGAAVGLMASIVSVSAQSQGGGKASLLAEPSGLPPARVIDRIAA